MAKVFHFRNAKIQGNLVNNKLQGWNFIITDKGRTVLAQYNQGIIDGSYFIAYGVDQFVFGTQVMGKYQGINCYKSSSKMILGTFRYGQPVGKFLQVNKINLTAKIIDTQSETIKGSCKLDLFNEKILKFIIEKLKLSMYLPSLSRQHYDCAYFMRGITVQVDSDQFQFGHIKMQDLDYFGFIQNNQANGMGILLKDGQQIVIHSVGIFKHNQLQGVCMINVPNQFIFNGQFTDGQIDGQGVSYYLQNDSYKHQLFQQGHRSFLLMAGKGFPHILISYLKKIEHLKQVQYLNQYYTSSLDQFPSFQQIQKKNIIQQSPIRLRSKQRISKDDYKQQFIKSIKIKVPQLNNPPLKTHLDQLRQNITQLQSLQKNNRIKSKVQEMWNQEHLLSRRERLSSQKSIDLVRKDERIDSILRQIKQVVQKEEQTQRTINN